MKRECSHFDTVDISHQAAVKSICAHDYSEKYDKKSMCFKSHGWNCTTGMVYSPAAGGGLYKYCTLLMSNS